VNRRRWIIRIGLLLILGAIINVAVAHLPGGQDMDKWSDGVRSA
jgi:hypothetical protein